MKTLQLIAIIVLCLLIGCATQVTTEEQLSHTDEPSTQRGMHTWKGQHISKVIKKWGQPQKVVEQKTGGQIYTWKFNVPIAAYPDARFRRKKDTIIPTIHLYTRADGIVYHWISDAGSRAVRPR